MGKTLNISDENASRGERSGVVSGLWRMLVILFSVTTVASVVWDLFRIDTWKDNELLGVDLTAQCQDS